MLSSTQKIKNLQLEAGKSGYVEKHTSTQKMNGVRENAKRLNTSDSECDLGDQLVVETFNRDQDQAGLISVNQIMPPSNQFSRESRKKLTQSDPDFSL